MEQILDRCKLEYQIAAWTEKLQESPFVESRYALRARGKAHARLGQWKRAAADFLKVSRGGNVEEKDHLPTLVALAACNDVEKFRELCQFLSVKYSDRGLELIPAQLLCEGVLMHPEGTSFAGNLVEAIDREMPQLTEDSPALPVVLMTRGLAYYRENKLQEALSIVDRAIEKIESCDEQVRQKLSPIRASALSLRSLALQKLKNSGEAAKALQEASDLIPPVWQKIIDPAQTEAVIFERIEFELDWIVAAVLLREAATTAAAQQPDSKDNDSLAL
jgi:tetratricopeptide (TPR) repeat protein